MSVLLGLLGAASCFFVYDGVDKSSGPRVLFFGLAAVLLFVGCIATLGSRPSYLSDDCSRFSSFSSSCD